MPKMTNEKDWPKYNRKLTWNPLNYFPTQYHIPSLKIANSSSLDSKAPEFAVNSTLLILEEPKIFLVKFIGFSETPTQPTNLVTK